MAKKEPEEASPELLVITRMYELAREMTDRVRGFPRDLRFVLGDRILTNGYSLLDILIEARYRGAERLALLARANIQLEQLRFQIRLAMELQAISPRQYELLSERVQEIGRMVGGWLKASRGKTAEQVSRP